MMGPRRFVFMTFRDGTEIEEEVALWRKNGRIEFDEVGKGV